MEQKLIYSEKKLNIPLFLQSLFTKMWTFKHAIIRCMFFLGF